METYTEEIKVFPKRLSPVEVSTTVACGREAYPPPLTVGHNIFNLQWMKPLKDENGNIVMRDGKPILIPK